MEFSKHNIFSRIKDSDNYYLINVLSGNADILDAETALNVKKGKYPNTEEFIEKGYLVDPKEEAKIYREKYLNFIDERATDEVQLFFVPSYACNFACTYCYQAGYENPKLTLSNEVIDAFFNYINTSFAGRRKYITVFGGEPLLGGAAYEKMLNYFVDKSLEHDIELAFVTNGYTLVDYIELLKRAKIREMQVTLDGTADVHDKRRYLHGKGKTFDKIAEGIDVLLENKIPVNLRMVVDKENIQELPKLADFAIEKGWTKSPLFKTQLGRNYELHECQADRTRLFSRIEMYEKVYDLLKDNPQIIEFHKPAFSVAKFLSENGELPEPLFDSCPGTKTEWAFDYSGNIYSCTATVGKEGEELGTFYPTVTRKEDIIEEWEERDVLSIEKCKDCSLQLACGGGCASVAKNKNGKINSADCRPVKDLLEMGVAYYF